MQLARGHARSATGVCTNLHGEDDTHTAQETLELVHAGHNKTGEVAITTLDFPDNETTAFWVGTEEGNVYQANRYDRAGAKAGLNQYDVYKGHSGPVMGLNFHPLMGPVDFSDLFLTCSVDWTVKLWRSKSLAKPSTTTQTVSPIYSFDEADDYVYDVKWHPAHPAVFASVDGSGKFDLWNLNADTEVCRATLHCASLISCYTGTCGIYYCESGACTQQGTMGPQGRSACYLGGQRRSVIHIRHWRHGYSTGDGMERHAEDCSGLRRGSIKWGRGRLLAGVG